MIIRDELGRFKKGSSYPSQKGKFASLKTRKKISESLKKYYREHPEISEKKSEFFSNLERTEEHVKKIAKSNTGKHRSEETIEKMRRIMKKRYVELNLRELNSTPEIRKRRSERIKKYWQEHPDFITGPNSPNWKGGITRERRWDKARERLKFIPFLENPFPEDVKVTFHHISNWFVVPMPLGMHKKLSHNNKEEHRERCNVRLFYLYGLNFDRLIGGR